MLGGKDEDPVLHWCIERGLSKQPGECKHPHKKEKEEDRKKYEKRGKNAAAQSTTVPDLFLKKDREYNRCGTCILPSNCQNRDQ